METFSDAVIWFGFWFEEGTSLPWHDAWEQDIEEWWRQVNGYQDLYEPYTAEGDYAPGWAAGDPRIKEFYDARQQWDVANPLPVRLVKIGCEKRPTYGLAVPATFRCSSFGRPFPLELAELSAAADSSTLIDFCRRFKIPTIGNPSWWLSAWCEQYTHDIE